MAADERVVIDTGIFIEYLRANNKENTTLFRLADTTEMLISSVTLYELLMGATNEAKKKDIDILTKDLDILPFGKEVAEKAF